MRAGDSRTRLGLALLVYMAAVILVATLFPFQLEWPSRWRSIWTGNLLDAAENVLLFLPLGFLLQLTRGGRGGQSPLQALRIGALASLAIETVQVFEAVRYPSVVDVATNALGAWAGAALCHWLDRRRFLGSMAGGGLLLALPLMGLVYLLIPLLWLDTLAAASLLELVPTPATSLVRVLLALSLGVCGALVLAGLQRYDFSPVRGLAPWVVAVGAMVWFLVGVSPALFGHPGSFAPGVLVLGLLVWWRGRHGPALPAGERRFEVAVLKDAAPAFGVYLAVLALHPLLEGIGPWELGFGFPGIATRWREIEDLRFLEQVAAFTLLGYAVAELRGRTVPSFRASLPLVLGWGAGAALLAETARGWHAGQGASVFGGLILAASAVYGAWIYFLQLAHVRALLDSGTGAPPSPRSTVP